MGAWERRCVSLGVVSDIEHERKHEMRQLISKRGASLIRVCPS